MEDFQSPEATAEIVDMTRGTQPGSGTRVSYTSGNIQRGALAAVLDVPQAARLLGIGRTLAYELVRTDQWPTPVIRVGRLIKIPSGPLIELMSTGYPTQHRSELIDFGERATSGVGRASIPTGLENPLDAVSRRADSNTNDQP